jgi:hypothetical protein
MKLAEALALRADLQKRVEQLRQRLMQSAMIQEGEKPPEEPAELLIELQRLLGQLPTLVIQINRTNLRTTLPDGKTLTEALAERDALDLRRSVLDSLVQVPASRGNRYSRSEIRYVITVDLGDIRRQIDQLAQQRRELDTAIQATNWATDLLE